jgi:endonuclease V-like protein UPF0215 family
VTSLLYQVSLERLPLSRSFFSFVQIKTQTEKHSQPVVATIKIHPGGESGREKNAARASWKQEKKQTKQVKKKKKNQVANDTMNTGSMQI